jgi:DNA-binding NarL/FixJ family response regulator
LSLAGEASGAADLPEQLRQVQPDLLLLDLSLPDGDGLEILKNIRREYPKLPVVILTMHAEDQFAIRAFRAGASGYVTKDMAADELVGAIRTVVNGRRYITSKVAELLAVQVSGHYDQSPHEQLSDREFQVLRMIAAGKPTRQIAAELVLSSKTVNTYRARILEKMRMKSTAELTAYVVRQKLVE